MADYLAGVKLNIDYSSVDAFLNSVKSAVDKLNALKDEGDGTSTSSSDTALLQGASRGRGGRGGGGDEAAKQANRDAERRHREQLQVTKDNTDAVKRATGGSGVPPRPPRNVGVGAAGDDERRSGRRRGRPRDEGGAPEDPYENLNNRLGSYRTIGAAERVRLASGGNPYGALNQRLGAFNSLQGESTPFRNPFTGVNERLGAYGASEAYRRGGIPYGSLNDRLGAYGTAEGAGEAMRLSQVRSPFSSIDRRLAAFGSTQYGESSGTRDPYASVNANLGNYSQMASASSSWKQATDATTAAQKKLADALNRDATAEAEAAIAAQDANRARDAQIAAMRRSAGQGLGFGQGGANRGTLYQQFMGQVHGTDSNVASGRQNTDYQTFGQMASSHAVRALSYVGPGLAIGAGIEELRQSIDEAQEAQKALAEVQAEFDALGQSDQFQGFSESIRNIATNTGLATSEVADLGLAMKGVFGNTQQAEIALNGIAEGAVAMGLNLQEAQQDVTAITQSFTGLQSKGGAAVQDVTNLMLHLQDVTGVQAKSIMEGVADAAPSANAVGLNDQQTSSIVAAAAQRSGQSGAVIGQTFAKLVDGLTQNFGQVFSAFQASPATRSLLPQLSSGKSIGADIPTILQGLGKLPIAEQQQIEQSLGINASAQPSLNALIQSSGKAQQISNTAVPANRTQEEFNLQMSTLSGSLERLRQDFVNFGVSVVNSGIGTALVEIINGMGAFVKAIGDLDSDTKGVTGDLAGAVAAFALLRIAIAATSNAARTGALSRFLPGGGGAAAAEEAGGAEALGGAATTEVEATSIGGPIGAAIGAAIIASLALSSNKSVNKGIHDVPVLRDLTDKNIENFVKAPFESGSSVVNQLTNKLNNERGYSQSASSAPTVFQGRMFQNGMNAGSQQAVSASLKKQAEEQAALQKAQTSKVNFSTSDFAGAQEAYTAGTESFAQLVTAAQNETKAMRAAFAATPNQANFEALNTAIQAQNQVLDQAVTQSQQFQQSVQQTGSPGVDVANISALTGDLGKEKTPAAKLNTVNSLVSAAEQQTQDEANMATTIAQKNAILAAGTKLTAQQEAQVNAALKANGMSPLTSNTIGGQATTPQAAYQAAQEGIQATQALSAANADEDPQKILQSQLAEYQSEASAYLSTGGNASDPAYQQLEAQIKTTNQQIADGSSAILQARLGLLAASVANDPVQALQYTLQQAQAALADAHGAAAQSQAEATIKSTNLQLQAAIISQADAVAAVGEAQLTAQGNPIGAAFKQYQQALQDVATRTSQDKQDGVNPAADTQLQNMVATAISDNTNYLQTQFSTIQTTTQEELYLGQITANQAIAQLEAGMQQAQGNQQLVLQYQQAIRQIQNSAGSSLDFDIPSSLLVNPTLYQAARVNAGGSSAYNDNRQVTVTINVNNGSQTSGAVTTLLNAIGGSATSGTTTGPLVGSTAG